MKRLIVIIGFLCGIGAGVLMILNNPLSSPGFSVASKSDAYQWRALEFFGIAFTPTELLGVSKGSINRSLGAKEVVLTSASVILLQDEAGRPAALATRLTAMNKSPDIFTKNVGVDTYTNIFWANAGSVLMHGYENRWPLVRSHFVASSNGVDEETGRLNFPVSAERPDKEPAGIVGGSGLFSAIGGRYSETIWQDPEQPGLYAGSVSLDVAVK